MKLYLTDQRVLCLSPKPGEFLMALSSNTPESRHNAFLDIRGQIVATFDQVAVSADRFFLVIGGAFVDRVKKHLTKHLFLNECELTLEAYRVYWEIEGHCTPGPRDHVIPLGSKGSILITSDKRPADAGDEEFTRFRLENQLPLQGVDYDNQMLLNIHADRYVSHTKGCYLGQEIIARVHHRGKPPKKLVVRSEGDLSEADQKRMTSKNRDLKTGEVKGFVMIVNTNE